MVREVSITVPIWNEKGSIRPLFERISTTLAAAGITYEIIAIDDHATDNSVSLLSSLASICPVRV